MIGVDWLDIDSVRDATSVDMSSLASLWHDAWHDAHAHLVPQGLVRARTLENFQTRLQLLEAIRVLGPPGEPVGFHVVAGSLLDHLYVAAQVRGTGLAAILLTDAEERLAKQGHAIGWLTCAVGNDRAARFYAKHGWKLAGTVVERAPVLLGAIPVTVWRYEKGFRS